MHKVSSTLLICVVLSIASLAWASAEVFEVMEIEGHLERASGPPELLNQENQDVVTPRILLAFGQLPQEYVSLALALRGSGIDLLRADSRQLDAVIAQAEAGEIDADPEKLRELRELMVSRSYLNWEPVHQGQKLAAGELLRADEDAYVSLRTISGVDGKMSLHGVMRLDPENRALAWSPQTRTGQEPSITAQAQTKPQHPEQEGQPGKDMSPRAAELFALWTKVLGAPSCPLRLQGPIAVNETSEEIHLALPLKSYVQDAGGEGDSAQPIIHVRYSLGSDGEMPFTLQLPQLIWLFAKDGEPIGLLRMAKQKTTGTWADAIHQPVQMSVLLQRVELMLGVSSIQEEAVERIDIEQLVWQTDISQGEQALWSGNGQFLASNVRIRECGEQVMDIGSLTVDMQVQDHDLEVFSALVPAEVEDVLDQDGVAVDHLFQTLLAASGTGQFALTLTELEAGAKIDPESLHIGLVTIKGGMSASNELHNKRDVNTTYEISDLRMKTEYSDLALGSLSFAFGLSGLNLEKLGQLAHWDLMEEGNPLSAFRDLLAGMEVNFSVTEMSGNHDWLDLSSLSSLTAGLSLSGVSGSAQDIGLRYEHGGLQGVKDVPAEFTPENAALGLRLVQAPVQELLFIGLLDGMEARTQVLALLSKYGTRLDLAQLDVDLPGGGIKAKGLAFTQDSAGSESGKEPVLEMETDLEIRGLDYLVQTLASHIDDQEEIEQVQAIVAFIKLAAEERVTEEGAPIQFLQIRANSQGQISANGKDLSPLFSAAGAQENKE